MARRHHSLWTAVYDNSFVTSRFVSLLCNGLQVQQQFAFIPDDSSATYVINVEVRRHSHRASLVPTILTTLLLNIDQHHNPSSRAD